MVPITWSKFLKLEHFKNNICKAYSSIFFWYNMAIPSLHTKNMGLEVKFLISNKLSKAYV